MIVRINSKEFWKRFQGYFMECVTDDGNEFDSVEKALGYFWSRFSVEFNYAYNKKRIPNLQARIADYLQGLPFGFDWNYPGIIEAAKRLGTADENTPEKKLDKINENWFKWLAAKIMQFSEKNDINVFKYA